MGALQDPPTGNLGHAGNAAGIATEVQAEQDTDQQLDEIGGFLDSIALSASAFDNAVDPPSPPAAATAIPAPAPTTSTSRPTSISTSTPTSFVRFPKLPTELRLKIWQLSFQPRVVEIHRRRVHYADDDKGVSSGPKWQSLSANPAVLAVSFEARGCALEHYTVTIRLAVNTPCERSGEAVLDGQRRLYLAPQADTLVVLGEFHVTQTAQLLRQIADQDRESHRRRSRIPIDDRPSSSGMGDDEFGLRRLALSASSFDHPGAGISMVIYSRTILQHLDQLTLVLYNKRMPPVEWTDGHCAFVECHDTYAYRRFEVGRASELKNPNKGQERGWMTVGKQPLRVVDLAFGKNMALEMEAENKLSRPTTHVDDTAALREKFYSRISTRPLRDEDVM